MEGEDQRPYDLGKGRRNLAKRSSATVPKTPPPQCRVGFRQLRFTIMMSEVFPASPRVAKRQLDSASAVGPTKNKEGCGGDELCLE